METVSKKDHKTIICLVRQLAQENFAPRASMYDRENRFPTENYLDLYENNLIGLIIPEKYGGVGADSFLYGDVLMEIAKCDGSTAITFNMHSSVLKMINELANEEQKTRLFREVVEKGKLFASVSSEPNNSLRGNFRPSTLARKVDGGYLVSGTKYFASLSSAADYFNTVCMLENERAVEDGLLMLVIPRDSPGITIEEVWDSMGMRGTASNTVHFKDVFVEERNLIGQPGDSVRKDVSDAYAFGYACVGAGLAEAALEFTIEYAQKTKFTNDDVPISHFPNIQHQVAEMVMALESTKQLIKQAAYAREHYPPEKRVYPITLAKYAGTEVPVKLTDMAIRVCGGRAYMKRFPLERIHRDARAGMVMAPNNDKCLEIIGKYSLGLQASAGWLNVSKED
jgi:alkylation response protein AidB-like acyl-CoA dehydrogenase